MSNTSPTFMFYHTEQPSEVKVLCKLIDTIYRKGFRCLVLCKDSTQMLQLDSTLWSYEQLSFVPHLHENDEKSEIEKTPVLLSTQIVTTNNPSVLILANQEFADVSNQPFDKIVFLYSKANTSQQSRYELLLEKVKSLNINVLHYRQLVDNSWEKIAV